MPRIAYIEHKCEICGSIHSSPQAKYSHKKRCRGPKFIVDDLSRLAADVVNLHSSLNSIIREKENAEISSLRTELQSHKDQAITTQWAIDDLSKKVDKLTQSGKSVVNSINEIKDIVSQKEKDKSTSGKPGTVYVVHEREFVEGNKPIFKVGSIESTSD